MRFAFKAQPVLREYYVRTHTAIHRVAATLTSFLSLAAIFGCGGNSNNLPLANPALAVADTGNERVLVYNNVAGKAPNAAVVLGQRDFSHALPNQGTENPGASTLNNPTGVSRDSQGNIYVADSGNDRVLIFQPPFVTGMKASIVIGQPDFNTAVPLVGPDATASGMGSPYSVTVDSKGNLWVADVSNERLLEYTPPFGNGMAATLAIGQTSTGAAEFCAPHLPTANTLCGPYGVSFDATGNLWVADSDSYRVLEYRPPFSTGMAASLELGHPSSSAFTSGSQSNLSASSFGAPSSIAFDKNGQLWVADFGANRVLGFNPPFSNGMVASTVLGQVDFEHGNPNQGGLSPAANTLSGPWGLAFDSTENLNVIERGNNRAVVFGTSSSSNANAIAVIGQPNFTVGSENRGTKAPANDTLAQPFSLSAF